MCRFEEATVRVVALATRQLLACGFLSASLDLGHVAHAEALLDLASSRGLGMQSHADARLAGFTF